MFLCIVNLSGSFVVLNLAWKNNIFLYFVRVWAKNDQLNYSIPLFYSVAQLRMNSPTLTAPSDRRHATLAKIMVNLAKSWLRSWLIKTLVKIMSNHDTWNAACHIMARSWQDLGKITMVNM